MWLLEKGEASPFTTGKCGIYFVHILVLVYVEYCLSSLIVLQCLKLQLHQLHQSVLFLLPKNGRESLELVSKPWNTNFHLEHFVRKNRTTFPEVPLLTIWRFSTGTTHKAIKRTQQRPTLMGVVASVCTEPGA